MKDLKTVLLLAIPLALVVAGALLFDFLRGRPDAVPARPEAPARPTSPVRKVGSAPPVAHDEEPAGPEEDVPPAPVPPVPGTTGITDPVLTLERAKALIARGSIAAWQELETLLRSGEVTDPVGIAQLLVEALAKGGNPATFVDNILPALADPDARAKAVEELFKVARDSTEPNALKAAFSLIGKVGNDQAVEELGRLARLQQRQEFFVPAVYAIASIGGATAAAELSRLLAERAGTDSEPALMNAIGRAGSPEMVASLSAHLAPDGPAELRLAAIRALGMTGRPEAVPLLKGLIGEGALTEATEAAVQSLSQVGGKEAAEELLRLRKSGGPLALTAGLSLGNVTGSDAGGTILAALPEETDEQIKVRMVDGIANTRPAGAAEALRERFTAEGESSIVRGKCAQALATLGDVESIDTWLPALSPEGDSDGTLQLQIVGAVERMNIHDKARPALIEKAYPALKALADRTPKDQALYFYAVRAMNMLEAARPRERGR